jgi:hypothetical protein
MRAKTVSKRPRWYRFHASKKRRVTEKRFREDPAFWLIVARHVGPVSIVDERGVLRATLSVPGPR